MKKVITAALLIAVLLSTITYVGSAQAASQATLDGWQVADASADYNESNGILVLSGDDLTPGPTLYKEFTPQTDFEVSLQVKAETLGEVNRDPNGAGEGFSLDILTNGTQPTYGLGMGMRARAGGQFELGRHNADCDLYGWGSDWVPFIYNAIEYNNGSAFWRVSPPDVKKNAPVQPDKWYTFKLRLTASPFTATAEVDDENGTLLGSLTVDDMNNFTFEEIRYVSILSRFGGTFYVKNFNITGIPLTSTSSPPPTELSNSTLTPTPRATTTPTSVPAPNQSVDSLPTFPSVSPIDNPTLIFSVGQQNSAQLTGVPPVTILSLGIAVIAIVLSGTALRKLFVKRKKPTRNVKPPPLF